MTDDLNTWFAARPNWLQAAASLLLAKGRVADEDIDALFEKCLREGESRNIPAAAIVPAVVFQLESAPGLRLCSIGNVKGINALAPRNPLDFGPDNMTVVYGGNGSGKSGYVRILKHACGARNPGTLHPNVFMADGSPQAADITDPHVIT
jgi:hypothetical protein